MYISLSVGALQIFNSIGWFKYSRPANFISVKIDADIAVTKDDEFPDLPRFGVRMFLEKNFQLQDTLEWDHRKVIVINIRLRATVCTGQM